MPAQVAYSASKAGLLGMIETIAAENAALGITANAILPGLVASAGVLADAPGDHRRLAASGSPPAGW